LQFHRTMIIIIIIIIVIIIRRLITHAVSEYMTESEYKAAIKTSDFTLDFFVAYIS